MLFNSPLFLFLFLPVFLALYFLSGKKLRNTAALSASVFFYAWGAPEFILVVIISGIIDWYLGNLIYKSQTTGARKAFTAISVIQNTGILAYFKYANFFVSNIGKAIAIFGMAPLTLARIALPIGVSFIVFEKITYTVDIYRQTGKPAPRLGTYLLYVFLFPKLLSGPIIKYHDIAGQLEDRPHMAENISAGLARFGFGLAKKVLIADSLGEAVDRIFKLSPAGLGFYNAWIGVICFALQIYFDFSGYSDMAIGICRMMGFRIPENFNSPYIAANFTEFWRRWHISLSTWIRDYLYIPLGGNRVPRYRVYFNLWLCFLISGLWHGANWTFVAWGVYHGTFLIADRLFWADLQKKLPRALNTAFTFFFLLIGWAIFRSADIAQAGYYIRALLNPFDRGGNLVYTGAQTAFFASAGLVMAFLPGFRFYERAAEKFRGIAWNKEIELAGAFLLCFISIGKISMTSFHPFLYFRF